MTLNKKNNQTNKLYAAAPLAQQISWQPIQKNGQPLKNMILQSIDMMPMTMHVSNKMSKKYLAILTNLF